MSESSDSCDYSYVYRKPMKRKRSKRRHKAKFSPEEDKQLIELVKQYGVNAWEIVCLKMNQRNERQCKDRWFYYLSPDLNKGPWTKDEDDLLIKSVKEYGPSWVRITKLFKGRTDVQIKNRWNVVKRGVLFDDYSYSEDENKVFEQSKNTVDQENEENHKQEIETLFGISPKEEAFTFFMMNILNDDDS